MGVLLFGCHEDMYDQPKYETYEGNPYFRDSLSMRKPPPGTVARGTPDRRGVLYTGVVDGKLSESFPFPVTKDLLIRGQDKFNVFCSPCHGRTGDGKGMVVQRGFPAPATFHSDTLRAAAPGHFFKAITDGFGRMYSYAAVISPKDRWAIVAYVRALQQSQRTMSSELDGSELTQMQRGTR